MGLIEPLAIISAVPTGSFAFGSVFLWLPLLSLLGIATIGLLTTLPRRWRRLRTLRLVPSTAA